MKARWILVLILALPVVGFAGWYGYRAATYVPTPKVDAPVDIDPSGHEAELELCKKDPIAFLEKCVKRYDETVRSYRTTFRKYERGKTKEKDDEIIDVIFRESPFSVRMTWKKGRQLFAMPPTPSHSLYVAGENDNKLLALAFSSTPWEKDVDAPDVVGRSRYRVDQFGFKKATERTIASMKKARAAGTLQVRFVGMSKSAEDRSCYHFVRTPYDPVEEDGINKLEFWIDAETLLQTHSILSDRDGKRIAEYIFTNVQINPEFSEGAFTRNSLGK